MIVDKNIKSALGYFWNLNPKMNSTTIAPLIQFMILIGVLE